MKCLVLLAVHGAPCDTGSVTGKVSQASQNVPNERVYLFAFLASQGKYRKERKGMRKERRDPTGA